MLWILKKKYLHFRDIFFSLQKTKMCYNKILEKYDMDVDYKKLWKLLIDKDMKKTDLIPVAEISSNVLVKMNKGEFISMERIKKLCKALECDVGDN